MVSQAVETQSMTPRVTPYDRWLQGENVRIYNGFFIEDTRTIELAPWERRGCNAAFLKLYGQEGISEAHVIEVAPGQTLPPFHVGVEEVLYVIGGRGLTTIWANDSTPKRSFEWEKRSLFYVPPNYTYQITNTSGVEAARVLIVSSLPLSMTINPDTKWFFENTYCDTSLLYGEGGSEFYNEAKAQSLTTKVPNKEETYTRHTWQGAFFPDMYAWDRLDPYYGRGAGGYRVGVRFPNAGGNAHMAIFDAQTYKKGHAHAGGVVIIIPGGDGYSIIWPNSDAQDPTHERVIIPWHESSVFVPPNRWFHQHFNVGGSPARYLAMHPPIQGLIQDLSSQVTQIEYPDEDPFIREYFASQLGQRGLASIMPPECYTDRTFEWEYGNSND
jgi:mannose-6-phosphate isomerase-like protein (cupin superfamily)